MHKYVFMQKAYTQIYTHLHIPNHHTLLWIHKYTDLLCLCLCCGSLYTNDHKTHVCPCEHTCILHLYIFRHNNNTHRYINICSYITKPYGTAIHKCMSEYLHACTHVHTHTPLCEHTQTHQFCILSVHSAFSGSIVLSEPAKVQRRKHLVPLLLKTPSPWVCGRVNQTPSQQGAQWKV